MIIFRLLIILIFWVVAYELSISQNFEWVGHIGGKGDQYGWSVAVDIAGNIYTAGNFRDTVDFDPSPNGINKLIAKDYNVFVQKLDPEGNFLWARNFGEGQHSTTGYCEATSFYDMTLDVEGNVYTTGDFNDSLDFDPSPEGTFILSAEGGLDAFLQKMDANGNFLWAIDIGSYIGDERGHAICTTPDGDVYLTGFFYGQLDFDPSEEGKYYMDSWLGYDVFILKLDPDGKFIWAEHLGGVDHNYWIEPSDIKLDSSGNLYITGFFGGTVDFDPSLPGIMELTSGQLDYFILKLDTDGSLDWVVKSDGDGYEDCWFLSITNSGAIYATGDFRGTVDFDPGPGNYFLTSAGNYDVFIQKLNLSGELIWARQVGGTASDRGWGIGTDEYDNSYIVGSFNGTVDFDPGPETMNLTSIDSTDGFYLKLDPSGNLIHALQLAGQSSTLWYSVALDSYGSIFLTGKFNGLTDFNPSATETYYLESFGGNDTFIQKLSQPFGLSEFHSEFKAKITPNPFTDFIEVNLDAPLPNVDVLIMNITGEILSKSTYYNCQSIFLSTNPSPGCYFLILQTSQSYKAFKIIKTSK